MSNNINNNTNKNTLIICHWNCRAIKRRTELPHLIDNNNIDILCLSETFLTPDHNFRYSNFNLLSNERNNLNLTFKE